MTRACLTALTAVLVLSMAPRLSADPKNATSAQAEWNAETTKLEVALRIDPEALKRALTAYSGGQKITLDTDDVDPLIERYLRDTFEVVGRNGERSELGWVGKELEHRRAWLYFEFSLAGGVNGVTIGQRMLFELEPTQLNTVRVRQDNFVVSFVLSREAPSRVVTLDSRVEKP